MKRGQRVPKERKRALVVRHAYPSVAERLDALEVRADFIDAQMKATLRRYDELAKTLAEKERPQPIDDDITRLAFGTKAGK